MLTIDATIVWRCPFFGKTSPKDLHLLTRFKEKFYVYTLDLLAVVPRTLGWSPTVGLVMILCNVLAIAFGRATIKIKDVEPASGVFLGMGLPAFIGTAAFGHLLGTGAILGLSNLGVL